MIYENERWSKIVKGQKIALAKSEKEYLKAITVMAEKYYKEQLHINRKQRNSQLMIVGKILEQNATLQQACANLKQDINKLVRMKLDHPGSTKPYRLTKIL